MIYDLIQQGIEEGWIIPLCDHNYQREVIDEGYIYRCQKCGKVMPYDPTSDKDTSIQGIETPS